MGWELGNKSRNRTANVSLRELEDVDSWDLVEALSLCGAPFLFHYVLGPLEGNIPVRRAFVFGGKLHFFWLLAHAFMVSVISFYVIVELQKISSLQWLSFHKSSDAQSPATMLTSARAPNI